MTKNVSDVGAFKTSTLRNVLVTPPYFHDGSQDTLWDVIDHYNKGGVQNPFLDGGIQRLGLTEGEIDDLVAFLASLTSDRYHGARQQGAGAAARAVAHQAPAARRRRRRSGARRRVGDCTGPFGDPVPAQSLRRSVDDRRPLMAPRHKSVETRFMEARDEALRALRALDRRTFLKVAAASAGAVLAKGLLPPHSFQLVNVAHADPARRRAGPSPTSPTRTCTRRSSTIASCARRSRRSTTSTRCRPQPDFVLFGGDLAQLGRPAELSSGAQILKERQGAGEDDGRRARLVPRHGRALAVDCSGRRTTRSITRACTSSCS